MKFVTVTDQAFLIGTAVLLHSISKNGQVPGHHPIVVHEDLTGQQVSYLKRVSPNVEIVQLETLPGIQVPADRLSARRRGRLKKLAIFTLFGRGKLCYLDSDMLCLGSLANLESFPHFSAAIDIGRSFGKPVNGYPTFNAGMLVFEPTETFASDLQAFCRPEHFERQADQFLLNDFMYSKKASEVHIIHSMFNTLASVAGSSPKYFSTLRSIGIRLIHFTNTKPWQRYQGLRGVRDVVLEASARSVARHEFRAWHELADDMQRSFGPVTDA